MACVRPPFFFADPLAEIVGELIQILLALATAMRPGPRIGKLLNR